MSPQVRRRRGTRPRTSPWTSRNSFDESFKMLRSNLSVALGEMERPIVIVTSSHANEGKTIVCTKLALSFAEAGRRVVLVDLDLRHPIANRLLQTHNEFGMSDVLLGRKPLRDCLQQLDVLGPDGDNRGSLYFIGTGPPVQSPTELLGSARTARALDGLAQQSDLVLVDTPPVLPIADTLVIGRVAAGAVLVVESSRTAFQAVQQSKDLLIRNQTRLLGVVLNKFQPRDMDYSYGYYGYGYGTEPDRGVQAKPSQSVGVEENGARG
jgi:capsular exopolysaccharide synthesis family protein